MMSRHSFKSEPSGAIAKRPANAKNDPSVPGNFSINSLHIYV